MFSDKDGMDQGWLYDQEKSMTGESIAKTYLCTSSFRRYARADLSRRDSPARTGSRSVDAGDGSPTGEREILIRMKCDCNFCCFYNVLGTSYSSILWIVSSTS